MALGHTNYTVYLCDPFGTRLGDASDFISLKYTRVVNNVSSAILTLPGDFNEQLIRLPDGRVEIWRRLPGNLEQLVTETTWLIKVVEHQRDERGKTMIIIEADTPLCLLREPGRYVDYPSDSATSRTASQGADNSIKDVVGSNLIAPHGSNVAESRNLIDYISLEPDRNAAPFVDKIYPWREVLKVCQELAASSAQLGTYLAFDFVAPTPSTLEFRTYTGQRGVDHRFPNGNNPIIIGPDFGNMGAASLRRDYRNEVTYARAGGPGEGSDRLLASSQDDVRIGASPFGRREQFVSATDGYLTAAGLASEADAAVRAGRPRLLFHGKLLDTPDTRFGVHWGWGDFVTVQAFGQLLDCRIDALSVTVAQGKETIEAVLRNDS